MRVEALCCPGGRSLGSDSGRVALKDAAGGARVSQGHYGRQWGKPRTGTPVLGVFQTTEVLKWVASMDTSGATGITMVIGHLLSAVSTQVLQISRFLQLARDGFSRQMPPF